MRRRCAALAACVLAAAWNAPAALAQESAAAPTRVQAWLEERLSAAVGGTVRFGSFSWSLTDLSAEFRDLRVTVPIEGAPPVTAAAVSGRLRLSWSGIAGLFGGRVHIVSISLEGPDFETTAQAVEALARRPSARNPVEIQVDRVEIRDGRVRYVDARDGLDVAVAAISYEGGWDPYRRTLEGPVAGRGELVRPPITRTLAFRTRGTLRVSPRSLEFVGMDAMSEGLTARLDGRLLLRGQVAFAAEATVAADLAALRKHLDPSFPALDGAGEATLRIDKGGPGFSVLGHAKTSAARLGPLFAESASGDFALRPGILEIRALEASAYGGRASGEVDVLLADPVRIRTRIAGSGLEVEPLLRIAALNLPVASRADGTFEIEGEPGKPVTWRGRSAFRASSDRAGEARVPAAADGEIVFQDGHARIVSMRAELAASRFSLDLDADLGTRPVDARLALVGRTSDAAATHAATLAFMRSLSVDPPAIAREPLAGAGAISATIRVGARPGLDLDLDLADGAWSGEPFDRAAFVLGYDGSVVEIRKLEAARGGQSLTARLRFGAAGRIDDADATMVGVPARSVLARAGIDVDVTGDLDGELRIRRQSGDLRGEGRFALRDAIVYGENIDELSGPIAIEAGIARVAPLAARGPAFTATAEIAVAPADGTMTGMLKSADVFPGRTGILARAGLHADGTVHLEGPISWSGRGPDASFGVTGRDLVVAAATSENLRVAMGATGGTLALTPEAAAFDLAGGREGSWTARGRLSLTADAPVDATIRLRQADLEVATIGSGSATLDVDSELHVSGPLARPEKLVVDGTLERVEVRLGSRALESEGPAGVRFTGGRLEVGSLALRDESSRVETRLAFTPVTGEVEADLGGTLDLALLNAMVPGLKGSGSAVFTASVRGSEEDPRLDGRLTVRGARMRVPGFSQPLDNIEVDARLENARAVVERFDAQCGGGAVRGTGSASFAQGRVASYEGALDVERVSVPFPEGFRGVYEGQLRLDGSAILGRLSGHLAMIRGLYGEDIDVLSLLSSSGRAALPDDESILPRRVLLDVSIGAEGNVWMRNNLGRVETRVDLTVGGTMARPELTGRLELFEGGTFRFRDVDYRIESGTIDLADPRAIRPLLDLRGTTRVRDVDIGLHVEGPVDRIRYELTSNPPLSEQDIIGLLLTGRTFEDATAFGGTAGFTGDVAANYFAGAVTARLGRQIGKALGLDRLQIDPLLAENGGDPTTRITAGKQLGPRVGFLYSTTLGATKDQSYRLEWEISRRLQFVTETRSDQGVGGDLRYRDRFGGGPTLRSARARSRARTDGPRVGSVALTGVPPAMSVALRRRLPFEAGAPYTRAALYEGAEALRRALVDEGRIESRVEMRVTGAAPDATADGAIGIVYEVEPGPEVTVRIEGSKWRDRVRQSRKLQRLWETSLFSPDLYSEGEDILLRDAHVRGYFAADVVHEHGDARDGRREVRYVVERGEKVRVKAVRILGTSGLEEERVRSQMLTRGGGLSFGSRILDPIVLDDDVRAIRVLYRNEGYLGARIEGPILRLSPEGNEVTITLRIDEGRRWVIGRIDAPTDLPVAVETLQAWSGLIPGRVFSPASMLEAESSIRANLDRAGYPESVVEAVYALADGVVNVSLEVATGPLKRVDAVEIVGNRRTKAKIIRREVALVPGEPLSREKILETQQRLYRLGIFRGVRVEDVPAGGDDPAARVVRVNVDEAAPIGFSLGPGYDSETGARLSFSLSHENLGGYDRSAALLGRWSSREKRLQIVGREPRLFNRQLTGLAAFFWEKQVRTGYAIERRSTAVRVERKLSRRWTRYLRYNFQRVDVTPEEAITVDQLGDLLRQRLTNVRLGDVGIAAVRDTRDDPFLTTRGGYASVDLRVFAKPLFSDATFAKISLGGSLTRTFPRGSSFSVALRLGGARPMGSTATVPLSERFFAGGESTVRGFRRDALGPTYSDLTGAPGLADVPVGGEGLLVINEEWRIPMWRALRGVVFIDAGNVFYSLSGFNARRLREGAGLGLRYDTPIGPLRLEYGWKLDRREGESPGELHLAIGSVF